MDALIQHPAFQAGIAPLAVALVAALVLAPVRLAGLAVIAGYATMVAATTGFSFTPMSASRKVLLLVLLAPLAGLAIDLARAPLRRAAPVLAIAAGAASAWAFATVLAQREPAQAWGQGAGIAVFVAMLAWLVMRRADDAPATGAAGVGLGLGAGIAALLSASTGYFMAGVAIAAASGALQLVQLGARRPLVLGATAAATIGIAAALFAAASTMLAQLPWYALPAMLAPAVLATLPGRPGVAPARAVVLRTLLGCAGAAAPVAAAWFAAAGA